ncbi:hypothetical protein PFISCL1PPCAC_3364, partial [Pristionchus fissidentatus]
FPARIALVRIYRLFTNFFPICFIGQDLFRVPPLLNKHSMGNCCDTEAADQTNNNQQAPSREFEIAFVNNEIEKKWDLKLVQIRAAAPGQSWLDLMKAMDKLHTQHGAITSTSFELEKQRFGQSIDRSLVEVRLNVQWISDLQRDRPTASFLVFIKERLRDVEITLCRMQQALHITPISASALSTLWISVQRAYDAVPDVGKLKTTEYYVTKQPVQQFGYH